VQKPIPSTRPKPKAIDLFSGCGGLTVGLKRAGFEVVGAVELDPLASETYVSNHPKVHLWTQDIKTLDPAVVMRELNLVPGQLDLLAGCPPCQGFSTIRTLNGGRSIIDERNDLIAEFSRFIRELRPKAIMFENVPALAKDARMEVFRTVLRELEYQYVEDTLDAAAYGVPQRRRRLMLLARRQGKVGFARRARVSATVHSAISHLKPAGTSGDDVHDRLAKHSDYVKKIIAAIPKDGGSRSSLPKDLQLACHAEFNGFKDVYGRMAWKSIAPTITGGCWNPSKGRFLHPTEDRAISLREAALLQTFPRRYKFPVHRGKSLVGAMIGNALPPEFVLRHARSVRRAIANDANP